jgi:tetratricopeptide (TPR) repeat protein
MRLVAFVAMAFSCTATADAQRRAPTPKLTDLEAGAATDSLDPDAFYRLALGYARAKRWDDEGRALQRAIAINPRYAPAYVALSFGPFERRPELSKEVRKGRVPAAWQDSLIEVGRLLHQAFIIDPLAELTPPDLASEQERRAMVAFNLVLALRFGGRPLDSLPSWVLWYQGLGAGRAGWYERAITDFQVLLRRGEALERDSIVPFPVGTNEYRYVLGVLCDHAGRPADARQYYQEALAGDLGNYMAHERLARLYRDHRMWREAVMEAQRAIETNPDDPTAERELGEILFAAGRLPEAEAAVREAETKNPRDIGTEYVLGIILEQVGRTEEARAALERFVALAPSTLYETKIDDARRRLIELPH